jgi:phosphate transporter
LLTHFNRYPQLKKLIYQIERNVIAQSISDERAITEHEPLLGVYYQSNSEFLPVLDRELSRVTEFYVAKEGELYDKISRLLADINTAAEATSRMNYDFGSHSDTTSQTMASSVSMPVATSVVASGSNNVPLSPTGVHHGLPRRLSSASYSGILEEGVFRDHLQRRLSTRSETSKSPIIKTLPDRELQLRSLNLYIALSDLESYVQLNYTAFTKILKKYDKVTGNHIRKQYMQESVRAAYPFHEQTKARLEEQIKTVAWVHGESAGIKDTDENELYLHKHLRDRVVFARNTVWRDMIGMERKVAAVGVEQARPDNVPDVIEIKGILIPRWLLSRNVIIGTISTIIFIALLQVKRIGEEPDGKCFALLFLVCSFWIFEVR